MVIIEFANFDQAKRWYHSQSTRRLCRAGYAQRSRK
jgi:uncharacterized protein (DUF1330 family)